MIVSKRWATASMVELGKAWLMVSWTDSCRAVSGSQGHLPAYRTSGTNRPGSGRSPENGSKTEHKPPTLQAQWLRMAKAAARHYWPTSTITLHVLCSWIDSRCRFVQQQQSRLPARSLSTVVNFQPSNTWLKKHGAVAADGRACRASTFLSNFLQGPTDKRFSSFTISVAASRPCAPGRAAVSGRS